MPSTIRMALGDQYGILAEDASFIKEIESVRLLLIAERLMRLRGCSSTPATITEA